MLILEFFGEHFPRERCHGTCDNCLAMRGCSQETKDCTQEVILVVDGMDIYCCCYIS